MQTLLNWLSAFAEWIVALVVALCSTIIDMFEDLGCWFMDEALHLVQYLLGLFSFDSIAPDGYVSAAFAALPLQVLNAFYLIGLPQALAMILAASFIRIMLQLVPFTRLGS